MVNAEMMNGNANDGEVPAPSEPSIINTFPLLNPSLSPPGASCSRAHGCGPECLPELRQAKLGRNSSPYAFIPLLLNICLATRVPIYLQLS
jgi:hypothetical protein